MNEYDSVVSALFERLDDKGGSERDRELVDRKGITKLTCRLI